MIESILGVIADGVERLVDRVCYDKGTMKRCVAKGVALFDQHAPGWHERVNPDHLNRSTLLLNLKRAVHPRGASTLKERAAAERDFFHRAFGVEKPSATTLIMHGLVWDSNAPGSDPAPEWQRIIRERRQQTA